MRRALHGALGGGIGAACMTVARMLAHRARLIDQMVPQAVEVWAKHQLPLSFTAASSKRALHHIADQLLHVGYGSGAGVVYGLALGRGRASGAKIVGYGVGVWVFGSFILLPALKIMRPEWRAKPSEIAVNLGAHLVYAAALALLTEELETQSLTQPIQYPLALIVKTG